MEFRQLDNCNVVNDRLNEALPNASTPVSFSPGFNRVISVTPNFLNRFNGFLIVKEVNR